MYDVARLCSFTVRMKANPEILIYEDEMRGELKDYRQGLAD